MAPQSSRPAGRVQPPPLALVVVGVVCVLLSRGVVLAGGQQTTRLLDRRQEVSAERLDAALQTFRPADHRGLAAPPLSGDDLSGRGSVRTQPARCAPLTLLATGRALDGQSWTGIAGSPLQPVRTLTARYPDAEAARHDLLAKRVALLSCRTVRLTFPPFDQPEQDFTVTDPLLPLAPAGVVRYSLRRDDRSYRFYVRRYANTLTWSYASDASTPKVRQHVVDSLVTRLQELERQ